MSYELDKRDFSKLDRAMAIVEHSVYKNYLPELKYYGVVQPLEKLVSSKIEDSVKMFKLDMLTCKKGEDVYQKLSTVYSASMLLGCSLIVMIDVANNDAPVNLYVGLKRNNDDITNDSILTSYEALQSGIKSNFPGTKSSDLNKDELKKVVDSIFEDTDKLKISSVSCSASIRDKSKTEHKAFIQGIERFIDAMSGNTYTALFIAEPISKIEQQEMREGYEKLYSTLSSFRKSVWSYNENKSHSVMESLSNTTSESIAKGTSITRAHSLNAAINFGINTSESNSLTQAEGKSGPTKGARVATVMTEVLPMASKACGLISAVFPPAAPFALGLGAILKAGQVAAKAAGGNTEFSSISETISRSHGFNGGFTGGMGYTTTNGSSTTKTVGHSQTDTKGKTDTTGSGVTLQIENENKQIEELGFII